MSVMEMNWAGSGGQEDAVSTLSPSSATPVVPDNQRLLHISSGFTEACSQGNTRPLQYPCITHFLMDSPS